MDTDRIWAAMAAAILTVWASAAAAGEEVAAIGDAGDRRVVDQLKSNAPISVDDLANISDYAQKLKMLEQIETTLKNIDTLRRERKQGMDAAGPGLPLTAPPFPAQIQPAIIQPPERGYAVARVTGREGEYSAELVDPDGRRMFVKSGSQLDDDTKVVGISFQGVEVQTGKSGKTRPLPFVSGILGGPVGTSKGRPGMGP